jgi:hypothetical protein
MSDKPDKMALLVKLGDQLEARRHAVTTSAKELALKEALNAALRLEWAALELIEGYYVGQYGQVEWQASERGEPLRAALERRFCLAHAAEGLIELGLVREEDLMELALVQQDQDLWK